MHIRQCNCQFVGSETPGGGGGGPGGGPAHPNPRPCERITINEQGPPGSHPEHPLAQHSIWRGVTSGATGKHQTYLYTRPANPNETTQFLVLSEVTGPFTDGEALEYQDALGGGGFVNPGDMFIASAGANAYKVDCDTGTNPLGDEFVDDPLVAIPLDGIWPKQDEPAKVETWRFELEPDLSPQLPDDNTDVFGAITNASATFSRWEGSDAVDLQHVREGPNEPFRAGEQLIFEGGYTRTLKNPYNPTKLKP